MNQSISYGVNIRSVLVLYTWELIDSDFKIHEIDGKRPYEILEELVFIHI